VGLRPEPGSARLGVALRPPHCCSAPCPQAGSV